MSNPTDPMAEDDLNKAVQKTVDYLYNIKGDVEPELYQAIATLRQLINEEFKPNKESISSQFIYDILNPAISAYTTNKIIEARIDELLYLTNHADPLVLDRVWIQKRIKALNHRKKG